MFLAEGRAGAEAAKGLAMGKLGSREKSGKPGIGSLGEVSRYRSHADVCNFVLFAVKSS